jgi:hypothetical protein
MLISCSTSYSAKDTFKGVPLEKKDLKNLEKEYSHEKSWAEKKRPKLGISLSGGGSKASPFTMGVLKYFVDNKWLDNVDIISSVSGGSYSAYYLYNKAIYQYISSNGDENNSDLIKYFANCEIDKITNEELSYNEYDKEIQKICTNYNDKYQKHVKENQDIMAFIQNKSVTGAKGSTGFIDNVQATSTVIGAIGLTIPTIPFHHISNTLFDWKIELSPSQYLYENGIINAFGNTDKNREIDTFENLRKITDNTDIPMWIINTSTFKDSWWLDAFEENDANLDERIFEITPYGFGSGKENYSYSKSSPSALSLDLPKATLASAAFLDSLGDSPYQGAAFGLLHLTNLRWGVKIPQYNTTIEKQQLHNLFPWPFYYLDMNSSKITLSDGGQSGDNLGLYALIKRGVENIVIISASNDVESKEKHLLKLEDMCSVSKSLSSKYDIVFKGNPNSKRIENQIDEEFNYLKTFCKNGKFYNKISYHEWERPIWEGYLKTKNNEIISNLYFINAAIDKEDLTYNTNVFRCKDNPDKACNENRKGIYSKKYNKDYPKSLLYFWNDNSSGNATTFPQTSTVFNTINSSSSLYQAYMDLGYFYTDFLRETNFFKDLK